MNDFEDKILKEIKEKKPKPRWQFMLKNYLVWFFGVLFLVFSSLTFTVLMVSFLNSGVEHFHLVGNFWDLFFRLFPYFWLIFTLIFLCISIFNFKHTEKGYKFNTSKILLMIVLIIFSANLILYFFGNLKEIERKVPSNLNPPKMFWNVPEEGRLEGNIIQWNEDTFLLVDFRNNVWEVYIEKAKIDQNLQNNVRVIGRKLDDNKFMADFVLPLFDFKR